MVFYINCYLGDVSFLVNKMDIFIFFAREESQFL
jgi:hypothetical protein